MAHLAFLVTPAGLAVPVWIGLDGPARRFTLEF